MPRPFCYLLPILILAGCASTQRASGTPPVEPVSAPVAAVVVEPGPAVPATAASDPDLYAPSEGLERFDLADGRVFIGLYRPATATLLVRAARRGGLTTPMPDVVIHIAPGSITARSVYAGEFGDLSAPPAPRPADPAREAELARLREAARAGAEKRKAEAAEEQQAQQRGELAKRLQTAQATLAQLQKRQQEIEAHAATLDADKQQQQALQVGLNQQLAAAQERWNQEVQTLGPRKTDDKGNITGGPTLATEALVEGLQKQIQAAQAKIAKAVAAAKTEDAELQKIVTVIPAWQKEIIDVQAAQAQLEASSKKPAP